MEEIAKVILVGDIVYIDGKVIKGPILSELIKERIRIKPEYKISYIDREGKLIQRKATITRRYELPTDKNFSGKVDVVTKTGLEIKEALIKNKADKIIWDEIKKRIDDEYNLLTLKPYKY